MQFNSIEFLKYFFVVSSLYFILPNKVKQLWLLLASYYFYMQWNAKYALLMLFSTFVTFLSGSLIQASKTKQGRRNWLVLSLVINLGILFFFKYANFTIKNLNLLFNIFKVSASFSPLNILLPVGISFYTFQALSYSIDTYRNEIKAERNFIQYALFVSFFPQLVAGPIERSIDLLPQLSKFHKFDIERFKVGTYMILWGFFQKVFISNTLSVIVDNVYGKYTNYSGTAIWFATFAFAIQIYTDFSAYSDIARGCAKIMGYELSLNFKSPYFSKSIAEFWRRWHITLGTWFREYVYFPLGGSRNGRVRTYLNITIVFLLSGLWHGASWNFVIWGGLHAIYQIFGGVTKKHREKLKENFGIENHRLYWKMIQISLIFILVCFAWVFFRADTLSQSFYMVKAMLKPDIKGLFNNSIFALGYNAYQMYFVIFNVLILFVVSLIRRDRSIISVIRNQHWIVRYPIYIFFMVSLMFYWVAGAKLVNTTFIYFQF